jgi:hypothetical protein
MPDDQSDDPWGQALAADPATRRRGAPPTVPQDVQGGSGEGQAPTLPPTPQAAPAPSRPPQLRPPASGDAIVSTAASLVGHNAASITPFLRQTGQSLDPTRANWCGAFVDGVLRANGVDGPQGPGKYIATSFLNWGQPADGDPQPGDVLVQPRGHPAGGLGGHVGIATGQIADAPGGLTFYLMQSGNLGGKVAYSWEPAKSIVVRRAPQTSTQAQQ